MATGNFELTPLVLVVDGEGSGVRSLEGVLRPKGYVLLQASSGQQALDLVSKVSPDVILLDMGIEDAESSALVRTLRRHATIRATTPILMIAKAAVGRAERLDVLAAGAWDILMDPIDPGELILRLDTFVQVKQEADRARDEGLTDPGTGVYNVRGVLKKAREVSADAVRFGRPLTCVVFGARSAREETTEEESDVASVRSRDIVAALQHVTRTSDTIGCLSPGEFAVLAPGTDEVGAVRLANRVLQALDEDALVDVAPPGPGKDAMRAGFYSRGKADDVSPEDLLLRATMALREAHSDGSFKIRAYEA